MGIMKTQMQKLAVLAAAGSLALMLGALAFQYIGGLAPCEMCIWQRWPHTIAIALGVLMFFFSSRLIALFGSLLVLFGAGLGVFHAGVEQHWWQGPTACTGSGLSLTDNLLDMNASVHIVMCDQIAWQMFGISMAGWNAILSLGLACLWFRAFKIGAKH